MDGPAAAGLCSKEAVCPDSQCLTCRKRKLIGNRRRRSAVALQDLSANRIVLAVETDPAGALDDDSDR